MRRLNWALTFVLLAALGPLASIYAADVPISGLPAGTTLSGTEAIPAVQTGATVKTTPSAISTYSLGQMSSTTILGKFTGTCNSTTYLRGDGACQTPPGAGTVTSVALTAPSWLTVGGSPITGAGTLALTATSGQTANQFLATPDGTTGTVGLRSLVAADLPSISLTSGVTGILPGANGGTANGFMAFSGPASSLKTFTLPNASATILTSNAAVTVGQGGTGAVTLSGLLKGNGISAIGSAASADVIGLWSGTCSSSTYMRGDGSCATPAGAGTVTSVALTMPGIFSVGGSPVTSSGTLAVTASGTSGGIPYFSSGTALASSAALTAHGVMLGGGAATAPTALSSLGTAGQVLTSNGTGADPSFQSGTDITGLPSASGVAAADLTLIYSQSATQTQQATIAQIGSAVLGNGFTAFTGPTTSTKTFTLPNASSTILTSNAAVTVAQGGTGLASGTSGGVPYFSGSTTIASSGALAANALVVGGGPGTAPTTTTTLNNGTVTIRVNPRVITAADATSVTPTADTADQTIQANTQSAGTLTMNAPTGTPVAGQKWIFRIKSTNVQTFSWNSVYRGSVAGALPTASSGSSLTDYFGFIYNATDSKWDYVSGVKGF